MKNLFPIIGLILTLAIFGLGQAPEKLPCPTISVEGPAGVINPGDDVKFTAYIKSTEQQNGYDYTWTVTPKFAFLGQNTDTISVKAPDFDSLTAAVTVKGFPEGCPTTASETYRILCRRKMAEKLGTILTINLQIDKDLIAIVGTKIQQDPTAQLYIALQFPRGTSPKTMDLSRQRLAEQLKRSNIPLNRIRFAVFDNDNRETIFWLVPPGADLPLP